MNAEQAMCQRVGEIISQWEDGGRLGEEEQALVVGHLEQCPRCAWTYGALLPFLRRDVGELSAFSAAPGEPAPSFTETLMRRIAAEKSDSVLVRRRRPARHIFRTLTLVACAGLLIGAGFLLRRWTFQQGNDQVLVRFELVAPEASRVSLVGDFSGWDRHRLAMKETEGSGVWQISVRLKKGRIYAYNFVVDETRWITDPRSLRQVDDGFGGTSSVIQL